MRCQQQRERDWESKVEKASFVSGFPCWRLNPLSHHHRRRRDNWEICLPRKPSPARTADCLRAIWENIRSEACCFVLHGVHAYKLVWDRVTSRGDFRDPQGAKWDSRWPVSNLCRAWRRGKIPHLSCLFNSVIMGRALLYNDPLSFQIQQSII